MNGILFFYGLKSSQLFFRDYLKSLCYDCTINRDNKVPARKSGREPTSGEQLFLPDTGAYSSAVSNGVNNQETHE